MAYPVTLSDPIPASLKVTGIGIEATPLPHWEDCAITGTDANGFGGTLNCQLSGALGLSASAPQLTLTVVVASTPGSSISNTATTCWHNPSLPAEAQKCASDTVVVSGAAGAATAAAAEHRRTGGPDGPAGAAC